MQLQQQALLHKLSIRCEKNGALFSEEYFSKHFSTTRRINLVIWLLLDISLYNYEMA